MKYLFFIFVILSTTTFGQSLDSLRARYDSLAGLHQTKFDSASRRINNRIDSIQLRINNILNPNLSANQLVRKIQKQRLAAKDSTAAVNELDSIKSGIKEKIDSLQRLNLPVDQYVAKLDSFNHISPEQYYEKAAQKAKSLEDQANKPIKDLENKLNRPVDNVESKVNEKLALMNAEGGQAANIPGQASVGNIDLPGVDINSGIGLDPAISDKIPKLPNADNPLTKVENSLGSQMEPLSDIKERVDEIKAAPQQQLDKVKSIDEVQSVQQKAGSANAIVDKVQAYQEDVTNIAKGDLGEVKEIPKVIENKVMDLEEMKDMQKYTGEINKYQEMISKGNDPAAVKELAKQQAMKAATDHFAGKEVALKEAMDKVSKLKMKYGKVTSLKDLPKRAPNAMKGKPLIERIVPGVTIQIQHAAELWIDINPIISYRFTGRFSAGAGWNERISFSDWNKTVPLDRIFGPRGFTSFALNRGFSVRAEVEKMNVYIPTSGMDRNRIWVWSVFAGVKKEYKFSKNVRGNVQFLYNLYDDHDNSPYLDRLNVRMGFEFPMKKKPKSTN